MILRILLTDMAKKCYLIRHRFFIAFELIIIRLYCFKPSIKAATRPKQLCNPSSNRGVQKGWSLKA